MRVVRNTFPAPLGKKHRELRGEDRRDEFLSIEQEVAVTAVRLAELDGPPPVAARDPDALSGRITALVADLVEPAKVEALDKLGEGGRAFGIAAGCLRAKLASTVFPGGVSAAKNAH